MRLLGTEVSLIGSTATVVCGTISSLNPGGTDASAQTYTVSCPVTTEPTIAVLVTDKEKSSGETDDRIVMNIAEVTVYVFNGKMLVMKLPLSQ